MALANKNNDEMMVYSLSSYLILLIKYCAFACHYMQPIPSACDMLLLLFNRPPGSRLLSQLSTIPSGFSGWVRLGQVGGMP